MISPDSTCQIGLDDEGGFDGGVNPVEADGGVAGTHSDPV